MKKVIFSILSFFYSVAFTSLSTRTVTTSSASITSADDAYVILHTGPAASYTLGTVSDGFSCKIVNHGTGDITLSAGVTTGNGQTITVLTNSSGLFTPGQIGNTITIARIGGVWRSI
jgi:hypothetical protein